MAKSPVTDHWCKGEADNRTQNSDSPVVLRDYLGLSEAQLGTGSALKAERRFLMHARVHRRDT